MRYRFIEAEKAHYHVNILCRVLEVSRSGYYDWLKREPSSRKKENQQLDEKIRTIHKESKGRYGYPRVHRELCWKDKRIGRHRVARRMKALGLRGKYKKAFRTTTQSNHNLPVSPNILNRRFHMNAPNQCWVSDISYLKSGTRWLYLCVIVDLFSRAVVGWSLRPHMRAELVMEAYKKAVFRRRPPRGLIFHSDRGVQFASSRFREELKKYQAIQSMSRKGDCWDNAVVESFFSTLKRELSDQFSSDWEANKEVFSYIEGFYNCKRLHSAIDYSAPLYFENQWRLCA